MHHQPRNLLFSAQQQSLFFLLQSLTRLLVCLVAWLRACVCACVLCACVHRLSLARPWCCAVLCCCSACSPHPQRDTTTTITQPSQAATVLVPPLAALETAPSPTRHARGVNAKARPPEKKEANNSLADPSPPSSLQESKSPWFVVACLLAPASRPGKNNPKRATRDIMKKKDVSPSPPMARATITEWDQKKSQR